MPDLLPTIFIVLGASALVLTLYWPWQSLRHAFAHVDDGVSVALAAGSQARTSLLAEKAALLVALKDLEAERDTGKLSETDYNELNVRYRTKARDVLKALDAQLAPHRDAAKALLAGAESPAEKAEPPAAAAPAVANACPSCATANDVDAVFCKKCGARLTQEAG
jgi:hypothetical protein